MKICIAYQTTGTSNTQVISSYQASGVAGWVWEWVCCHILMVCLIRFNAATALVVFLEAGLVLYRGAGPRSDKQLLLLLGTNGQACTGNGELNEEKQAQDDDILYTVKDTACHTFQINLTICSTG